MHYNHQQFDQAPIQHSGLLLLSRAFSDEGRRTAAYSPSGKSTPVDTVYEISLPGGEHVYLL